MLGCMEQVRRTAGGHLDSCLAFRFPACRCSEPAAEERHDGLGQSLAAPLSCLWLPTYAPCKLLREEAAAEAVIACTTAATGRSALRHDAGRGICLAREPTKRPLSEPSTEMALGCTRVARCGPLHVLLLYCVALVHAYMRERLVSRGPWL